ncbi:MAG: TetR family transcriptional regulator, partial [Dietzia sp.]|nr:TetR family transcriptional regulator [Dietzia sp.]
MYADDDMGLRERKKRRTREAVRLAAFELFQKNGYPNTTIEQIAEVADVSP